MKSKLTMVPSSVALSILPGSSTAVLSGQATMPAVDLSGSIKKESLPEASLLMHPLKERPSRLPQSKIREKDLKLHKSNEGPDLCSKQLLKYHSLAT